MADTAAVSPASDFMLEDVQPGAPDLPGEVGPFRLPLKQLM